jgi:hypothetical protein
MTLERAPRQLFEEIKYKRGFPPRARATAIKNDLASRGLGRSGALAEEIAGLYREAVEAILDDFADVVLSKSTALAIGGEPELRAVIADVHQLMFAEARGCLLDEFDWEPDYGRMAAGILDSRIGPVWEHLERKVQFAELEATAPGLKPAKEREQKFGILLSPGQAGRDFEG